MCCDGIDRSLEATMPSQSKINSWSFLMPVIFMLGPAVEPLEGCRRWWCSVQIIVDSWGAQRALHHQKVIF